MGVLLFLGTLSFLFTTPGVAAGSGFPVLSVLPGQFLLKDLVLVSASLWTLGDSLGAALPRRSAHGGGDPGRPWQAQAHPAPSNQGAKVAARWLARSHQLGIAVQYFFGLGAPRVARIGPQETVSSGYPFTSASQCHDPYGRQRKGRRGR
jgi:Protein of unknown function, DUF417